MDSFLIIGGSVTEREASISRLLDTSGVTTYDRVVLLPHEKPSIGISDVKSFIKQLQFNPQGKRGSAGIIPDAALLTNEAQQALLKTIEEPPPNAQLYIGAASETQVLATIASRCQITRLITNDSGFTSEEISACTTLIQTIVKSPSGSRISHIQSIGKTRDETKRWINCAIIASREIKHNTSLFHALIHAKKLAANNINPFQLLEHIFLTTSI